MYQISYYAPFKTNYLTSKTEFTYLRGEECRFRGKIFAGDGHIRMSNTGVFFVTEHPA